MVRYNQLRRVVELGYLAVLEERAVCRHFGWPAPDPEERHRLARYQASWAFEQQRRMLETAEERNERRTRDNHRRITNYREMQNRLERERRSMVREEARREEQARGWFVRNRAGNSHGGSRWGGQNRRGEQGRRRES